MRAISELPFHLTNGDMFADLVNVLTDLRFIELKAGHGRMSDLLRDYAHATRPSLRFDRIEVLREWAQFVRADAHVLAEVPELTVQQAMNQPNDSAPATAAQKHLVEHPCPLIAWKNKSERSRTLMTFAGFADPLTCALYSADGRTIACAARDCVVRVYEAEGGTELVSLAGHSQWVVSMVFTPSGSELLTASWDGTLKLWDLRTGNVITTYMGTPNLTILSNLTHPHPLRPCTPRTRLRCLSRRRPVRFRFMGWHHLPLVQPWR